MAIENSVFIQVIFFLLLLVIISVTFSDYPIESTLTENPLTPSLFLPKVKFDKVTNTIYPTLDRNETFWTPIELDLSSSEPIYTFCKLDFKKYTKAPHAAVLFFFASILLYLSYSFNIEFIMISPCLKTFL